MTLIVKGNTILFDDADWPLISQYRWSMGTRNYIQATAWSNNQTEPINEHASSYIGF